MPEEKNVAKKYTQFDHYTLVKRGGRWHFYYYEGRKRVRRSTGKSKKSDALKVVAEYFRQKDKPEQSFREYARPYFLWETCPRVRRRLDEGKSIGKTHVQKSRRWLEVYVFADPIFPHLQLSRIRRADILELRNRLKKKAGLNTVNKVISTVKTILAEAYFRQDIEADPGSKIGVINYDRQEKGILSREELAWLFAEVPGVWDDLQTCCVFNTAARTGMRCGELLGLTWAQLNFDEETIDISRAWKDKDTIGPPKSGRKRRIPVVGDLLQLLQRLEAESVRTASGDLVFCYGDGTRLGVTWWRKAFGKAMDAAVQKRKQLADLSPKAAAEIPDLTGWNDRNITPHSLRHSLNSHLLAAGCDPIKVRAYMGWSDNVAQPVLTPVQTGYTHWSPEHLRDLLPFIENLYEQIA
jgi:integrase